ncbi:MAG: hypothetical protein HZY79_12420 [Rhodoblastus sp.]|nr:MAG: hypothetical protein HZY79_12420 [Rhodoblastus sp.]
MIAIHLARDVNRMTLEDVISAIDEAERQIDSSFSKRAVDGIINFTFVAGARTVSEKYSFRKLLIASRTQGALCVGSSKNMHRIQTTATFIMKKQNNRARLCRDSLPERKGGFASAR